MPPAGLEPALPAPEADALSAELRGLAASLATGCGSPGRSRYAAPMERVEERLSALVRDALAAPVIRRRADVADAPWVADPWACIACGSVTEPLPPTCGGPPIPRLCPDCRTARRADLPDFRVMVCGGGCCTREGGRAVVSALRREVVAAGAGSAPLATSNSDRKITANTIVNTSPTEESSRIESPRVASLRRRCPCTAPFHLGVRIATAMPAVLARFSEGKRIAYSRYRFLHA